ncbi:MAG TPA: hypothetical protein VGK33_14490 [Chloroflexota bacterium]
MATDSEPSPPGAADVAEQCRADFLHALAHLNLDAGEGTTLVELLLSRPFESCGSVEICRAVEVVREMLRRTTALPPETRTHA